MGVVTASMVTTQLSAEPKLHHTRDAKYDGTAKPESDMNIVGRHAGGSGGARRRRGSGVVVTEGGRDLTSAMPMADCD